MRIGVAQLNPVVGDVAGNLARIREARSAVGADCDLLLCGELMLIGYPPEDLVLRPAVVAETRTGPAVLVTAPWAADGVVYNAVVLLAGGRVEAVRYKHDLPNYGVFDE